MSSHRVFATGPVRPSGVLPLAAADVHHLVHVRRVQPGEEIVVVSDGVAARVRVTRVGAQVEGELIGRLETQAVPRVTLVQGLAKGEKMDTIVRQATELGVWRIVPLVAERSVVRLDAARAASRVERWRRIATESAKQAQRPDVPDVLEPVPPGGLAAVLGDAVVLVCQEEERAIPGIGAAVRSAGTGAPEVAVVVGPEGGLAPGEVAALERAGARRVTLGPTVLRTETAGVVAVALALQARGGLGGSDG